MNRFRRLFVALPGSQSLKLTLAALIILTVGLVTGWTLSGPTIEAANLPGTAAASTAPT